jgi:hypothetical protein
MNLLCNTKPLEDQMNHHATLIRTLFTTIAAVVLVTGAAHAQCLSGWQFQAPITIDNSTNASALTNFQVAVTLNTSALVSAGKMRSDGNDIRFTDGSCTLLSYWIESGMNTATTKIWVKVPSIGANSTAAIKLFYGNVNATSASDGNATFELFDDFDGSSVDAAKWSQLGDGTTSVSGGAISLSSAGATSRIIRSNAAFATPIVAEMKVNSATGSFPNIAQLLPSTINGYVLGLDGTTMNLGRTGSGCTTVYSMILGQASTAAGTITGVWGLSWGATASQRAAWPGGTLTLADNTFTLGSTVNVAFGLLCSGQGAVSVDWARARKFTATEPTSSIGTEQTNCIVNWGWRVPVTITNSGSALTDFQVAVTINTATLVTAGKMNSAGNDIRFTDGDCCTPLPYWIESGINTATTKIWVRVPSIPNGTRSIDLYYGNTGAIAASSGNATFPLFDNFDGSALDAAKWTALGDGTISVSGGAISFNSLTGTSSIVRSNAAIATPLVAEMKVNSATGSFPNIAQILPSTINGYVLGLSGTTMNLGRTGSGCTTVYSMILGQASTAAGTITGVWGLSWGATASQRAAWPGGTLTLADNTSTLGSTVNVAFGLLCSGQGTLSTDWVRARKFAATEPTTTPGTEVTLTRPSIGTQPVSQTVCLGTAVGFSVGATGTGLSYQWRKNGIDIPGATTSAIAFNPSTLADAGSYTVLVRGSNCTETLSDAATLSFNTPTLTVALSPNSIVFKPGKLRTIYATVTAGGVCTPLTTVLESITANEAIGATDIQFASFNTSPADLSFNVASNRNTGATPRVYTVTYKVTDAGGMITRTSATVTVPLVGGMKPVSPDDEQDITTGGVVLEQNVPNPFGGITEIAFVMSQSGRAAVRVIDLNGTEVATLVNDELSAGRHVVQWNGRQSDGRPAPSGVYFYRVEAAGTVQVRTMTLVR